MDRMLEHAEAVRRGAAPVPRLGICAALMLVLPVLWVSGPASGGDGQDAGEQPLPDLGQIEKAFERVVEQVSPSVVGIRVQRRYMTNLMGANGRPGSGAFEQLVTVNGSGTIIESDGLILTNEHVIQSASEIEVFFNDGQSLPATVVSADPRGDLAVLKVERTGLKPARIVDWPEVKRGQWTITLGNPYGLGGDGKSSVAVGFISNLGRRLPGLGEVDDRFYADMIQTTADIHAGCSGGPLFNVHGELVGVVTAMHTRAPADEGVGFAIPMTPNRRRSVRALCEGREITYGYIGLEVRPMQPEERQTAGLGPRVGAVVQAVEPGGPGGEAGLREGDLILSFDGQEVRGPGAFAELVGQTSPGRTVPVELQRGAERLVVRTEVQRREISRVAWMRGGAVLWRGMRVTDATAQVRQRMGVAADSVGVVVIDVADDSPAQRAALQIGDVIERVAETPIQNIAGFQASVRGKSGPLKLLVRSRGELLVHP